jgi:hypothetical protein
MSNLVDVPENRVKWCRDCGACITLLQGKKSGKWYAVNVLKDSSCDQLVASPFAFHKCKGTKP